MPPNTAMERSKFLRLADEAITRVEDWLEEFDPDEVDFSSADGVIKIQFANGPTFVLNRQTAADQMWYASGVRAWHYLWDEERRSWLCDKDGHELFERIGHTVSDQLGRSVTAL